MNEDDLVIAGFNHHERSVVIEHCSFGYHDPILGSDSLDRGFDRTPIVGADRLPGPGLGVGRAGTGGEVKDPFA
jgi:hypothetical protein